MKIGRQRAERSPALRRHLGWLCALALAFVLGLVAGIEGWHERLIRGLRAVPTLIGGLTASAEDLPTLVVDMDFALYNEILNQRQAALERGVYVPSARDFVTATVRCDGSAVPVRTRLLAGLADRLGPGEKWGFEVRTQEDGRVLGLQRFYLLDPAANGWLNQWAFARVLEREDVLVARYQFVRLVLNGRDWGIYALQEGFADELTSAMGRPPGVIVEFDADLLWESVAHFEGDAQAAYADPVANLSAADFQYFEVDAFRDATISRDPDRSVQRETAIGLLRALQTGRLPASEVFDVERYGRFLALVDLWDATQATSLVNLRYFYSSASGRLEPIGFRANPLSRNERVPLAATYGDPAVQAAYVREAARIGRAEYVDRLQAELEPELGRLRRALRGEAGNDALALPWASLRDRQEHMRRSLDPVQPVFAYLRSPASAMSGTVGIDVANILNLPLELVGFDFDGLTFLPADHQWLSGDAARLVVEQADGVVLRAFDDSRAPVVRYVHFEIPLTEIQSLDQEIGLAHELDVRVATRLLGLSATQLTPAQPGYPDVFVLDPDE